MKKLASFTAALAVASSAATAFAGPPWIEDRAAGEGMGIRTGSLELHPSIAAELGYDSNYFQRADDEEPIVDFIRLRITPSLTLSTLGSKRRAAGGAPPKLNFSAGVYVSYNEFFATDSDFSDEASDRRDVGVGANFLLDILPEKPVGFDIYGDFVRAFEPSNSFEERQAFDRDSLRLGAGVTWRPGGGLFDWRLGYEGIFNLFEKDVFTELDNTHHLIKTRNRWRFLPRTAILADGQLGFIRYGDSVSQNDAQNIQGRIGVNGLITNHFALLAMGGWAASFYERVNAPVRNYDGPVAHAQLTWFILPQPKLQPGDATVGLASIGVGYLRRYANSYLGDYYRTDRGYAKVSYGAGGVFVLVAEGGLSHITHSSSFFSSGALRNDLFTENRVGVTLFGEYRASDIFGINTTLRYNAALDDNRIRTSEADPTIRDNLQFKRFEAWLGARLFW